MSSESNNSSCGASFSIGGVRNAMVVTNNKHFVPFLVVGGLVKWDDLIGLKGISTQNPTGVYDNHEVVCVSLSTLFIIYNISK